MAVQRKVDEIVTFGRITRPPRSARDSGMKQAMNDPRTKNLDMPFNGQRLIYGCFEVMLNVS